MGIWRRVHTCHRRVVDIHFIHNGLILEDQPASNLDVGTLYLLGDICGRIEFRDMAIESGKIVGSGY